ARDLIAVEVPLVGERSARGCHSEENAAAEDNNTIRRLEDNIGQRVRIQHKLPAQEVTALGSIKSVQRDLISRACQRVEIHPACEEPIADAPGSLFSSSSFETIWTRFEKLVPV